MSSTSLAHPEIMAYPSLGKLKIAMIMPFNEASDTFKQSLSSLIPETPPRNMQEHGHA